MSTTAEKTDKKEERDGKGPPVEDNRVSSPQGRYVRLEARLGAGAYKDVWRAYDTIEGIEVAWNVIKLGRVPPNERKRIKTEVKLLKDIEHPNVIKYHNSWVNRELEEIVFITEIMSSGSLKDYIKKNPMIRWNAVKRWCRQILKGLEFLHGQQIIHRDIKCDNVFINGSTGDIRIGDLGLSTKISETRVATDHSADGTANGLHAARQITAVSMTCLGTPEFMAPELYDENYNEKVDIYAFGMACVEMVTALTPYHQCTSAAQIYKKVLNGELPNEVELIKFANARRFVEACLRPEMMRPSATDLLADEFLLPNEEDDFLEVRPQLDTVKESAGGEEEDDESDEDERNELGGSRSTSTSHVPGASWYDGSTRSQTSPPDNQTVTETVKGELIEKELERPLSPAEFSLLVPDSPGNVKRILTEGSWAVEVQDNAVSSTEQTDLPLLSHGVNESIPANAPSSDAYSSQNWPNERCMGESVLPRVHEVAANGAPTADVSVTQPIRTDMATTPEHHVNTDSTLKASLEGDFAAVGSAISSSGTSIAEFRTGSSRVLRLCNPGDDTYRSHSRSASFSELIERGGNAITPRGGIMASSGPYGLMSTSPAEEGGSFLLSQGGMRGSLASGLASSPVSENFIGVVDLENRDENKGRCLVFRLRVPFENTFKEVEFEFDLDNDEPQTVVEEMNEVDELMFVKDYAEQIVQSITPVVEISRSVAREIMCKPSITGAQKQPPLADLVFEKLLANPRPSNDDGSLAALSTAAGEKSHMIHNMMTETNAGAVQSQCNSHQPFQHAQSDASGLHTRAWMEAQNESSQMSQTRSNSDSKIDSSRAKKHESSDSESELENDEEFITLQLKFQECLGKIEKDFHHMQSNVSSQREKADEGYRRELERLMNRKDDLDKQLHALEKKYEERMAVFTERRVLIRDDLLSKYRGGGGNNSRNVSSNQRTKVETSAVYGMEALPCYRTGDTIDAINVSEKSLSVSHLRIPVEESSADANDTDVICRPLS